MDALDQKLSTEISEIKKMLISLHKHQVEDRNRRSISETASTSIQQQQQQRPPQQQPKVFEVHLPVSVMRVNSDTFGDPIFQKGLQN